MNTWPVPSGRMNLFGFFPRPLPSATMIEAVGLLDSQVGFTWFILLNKRRIEV
jgi:hypothetical protein